MTAIDSIDAPRIELAIRSINASSGRDATNVAANSDRGERVGITAPFENASEDNNVLHISNVNDETRKNISDDVSESSVPEIRFDQQSHTYHSVCVCVCVCVKVFCSFEFAFSSLGRIEIFPNVTYNSNNCFLFFFALLCQPECERGFFPNETKYQFLHRFNNDRRSSAGKHY